MGPYTHYRYAVRFLPHFQPRDPAAYLFGALAPDIRYLARIPRKQTHLNREAVRALCQHYPDQQSFVMGYRLHCLLDEICLSARLNRAFPFRVVRRLRRQPLSNMQATVLVELDAIRKPLAPQSFHGGANPILRDLGIASEVVEDFSQAMQAYLQAPTLQTAMDTFQRLNIVDGTRLAGYKATYDAIQKRPLLRAVILWGVRSAGLDVYIDRYIARALL